MPQESFTPLEMRKRQRLKIREVRKALLAAGFVHLDQQSDALGLGRSTTWAVLKGFYKGSGLSARLINSMMASPKLPPEVRSILVAYVEEKLAGRYGHSPIQLERFQRRLAPYSHRPAKQSDPQSFGVEARWG